VPSIRDADWVFDYRAGSPPPFRILRTYDLGDGIRLMRVR
jgi:hypothetical protein